MANELAGVLTDLGAYLIEQAYQAGEVVQITEMALGDGGGSEVIVSPGVTELVGEFHRQLLDNGPDEDSALGGSINYIPLPEHAGKWLREFGLYDSLGNLIVYAASSPAQLPENPNMAVQFIVGLMVPIMNIEAIEIVINPEGVLTNEDLREHEQSRNHPAAIEGAQGMIPLATQAMVDEGVDHASAVTPKTAGDTFAKLLHEHDIDDILWLQEALDGKADIEHQHETADIEGLPEALDGKLNRAGDTATGPLIAPKFTMNDEQGTEDGDAVRYDFLNTQIPKRPGLCSSDLNSHTSAGIFHQSSNSAAESGQNYPAPYQGTLLVFANGGGSLQIYSTWSTMGWQYRRIYYRTQFQGSFSSWLEVYDTGNKPTPDEIGASPVGHTHNPGDVGAAPIDHVHTAAQGNQDVVAGGYGQVGTYVLAWNSDGQSVFIGNTKPGSVLIPATAGERREDGTFLSGTYKCLGHVFGGGNADDATTLWIRIA